ncbi:MAG: hypothetical protein QY310_01600 [Candidatus Jettenia sp. CY-1]|nr:MAG: hypothetical protein QY310_01600 [Candidatus Jettenia sp. CY-1]
MNLSIRWFFLSFPNVFIGNPADGRKQERFFLKGYSIIKVNTK